MIGALVPVILLPRITSYVGMGEFATSPLDVEAFAQGDVTLWIGPIVGGENVTLGLYFEESHDALTWTPLLPSPIADPGPYFVNLEFSKRWMRVRTVLNDGGSDVVAVSLYAAGAFEVRVP